MQNLWGKGRQEEQFFVANSVTDSTSLLLRLLLPLKFQHQIT